MILAVTCAPFAIVPTGRVSRKGSTPPCPPETFTNSGGPAFSDRSLKEERTVYIVFRDELGLVSVPVDEYGIQFTDGIAYFSDGKKEYRIPLTHLYEITNTLPAAPAFLP